ncbi:MAG: hypothetical protein NVV63_14445 [Opitutus sp.]|nr:hypothetical protein [Opitutus sp.]
MKNVAANLRYWASGFAIAGLGVIAARWIAPGFEGTARLAWTIGGELFALTGLLIIAIGVRRRVAAASAASNDAT